ncbi:MAG: iron ABC transporter substrate-binding protein [Rhizobiales bacterium 65-9]|nr:ABC transporter substrate-binding protein [Hyphomicrobiales bacterium]OJY35357.1 MAG: iron ABC transporter substrate-binding protein [Rhizobiales bacterium 65-9]
MLAFHHAVRAALLGGAALFAGVLPAVAQGQVTVYCSILEEQCREGAAIFERTTGVKVSMVRKSTGEVYAQVKAEASNPKGDVWWGGPGEPHLQAGGENLLEEYRSPLLPKLRDWAQRFSQISGGKSSAIYLGALGVAYNTDVLKKKNLPEPKCWADLLNPKYRDEVQVADPSSSGTAYVFLATTVQRLGEEPGFEFLKTMHKNVNQYTKSGIAPLKAVATGETAISIGFIHDMYTQILAGAPIKAFAPCEGTGYETGAVSMIKGAKNAAEAKKFIDFTLSPAAQEINNKLKIFSIPSNTETVLSDQGPDFKQFKLIDYDTAKWGTPAERSRLLKRFDTDVKSLPK